MDTKDGSLVDEVPEATSAVVTNLELGGEPVEIVEPPEGSDDVPPPPTPELEEDWNEWASTKKTKKNKKNKTSAQVTNPEPASESVEIAEPPEDLDDAPLLPTPAPAPAPEEEWNEWASTKKTKKNKKNKTSGFVANPE